MCNSETAHGQEPVAWVWNPTKEAWEKVHVFGLWQQGAIYAFGPTPPAAPVQEPVKPYAYEYGRDNGDGTYSVVIDKGSLVQTQPAVYNYVRPQNAHKNWPIKELFDRPPAAQPVPNVQESSTSYPMTLTCTRCGAVDKGTLTVPNVQRQWVGLTDEEFLESLLREGSQEIVGVTTYVTSKRTMGLLHSAKLIRDFVNAKLKEKNDHE